MGEGETNGVDGAQTPASCGFDYGTDVGVELGSPFGSEAVVDFSVDRAGAQGALGAVVGGLPIRLTPTPTRFSVGHGYPGA